MKHARFFSVFVLSTMAIYAIAGFYFLPLANFEGDLTRIGMLPESQFGWTKEQPAIDPNLMQQSTLQDADVLVIGDSFSAHRVWQSELVRHGLRVRSEDWTGVRNICDDFAQSITKRGFQGKYVIFEIVERNLEQFLNGSLACKKMEYHSSVEVDMPHPPPPTHIDPEQNKYSGRLSVGIQVRFNMLREKLWGHKPEGLRLQHMTNGCTLFSHPRCDDILFLGRDSPSDLGENVLAKMEEINKRVGGYTPVWLVAPNKSTPYLYPDKKFWDVAEKRLHVPNVLRDFRDALRKNTVDLYPANNTHLSTTGYLIMGNTVYQSLH